MWTETSSYSSGLALSERGGMAYNAELRMSPREHQTSKSFKEKVVSLRSNRIRKSLDYSKVENPLYEGQHNELRQSPGQNPAVQLHSFVTQKKQWLNSLSNEDDDLVKYMRNLPGYLQRVEKGENLQGKALNFGVLDWGRLENWKSNEKRIPPRLKSSLSGKNPALAESASAMVSRTTMSRTLPPQRGQQASNGCQMKSSCAERLPPGVRWPRRKAIKIQNSETVPGRVLDGAQTPLQKDPSFSVNHPELDVGKGEQADQMTTSEREMSSSDSRKHGLLHSQDHIMRAEPTGTEIPSEENIDHADDPCRREDHNVVLFSPGDSPRSISSQELWPLASRKARDNNLTEASESRFANFLSPEKFHSGNPFFEVPHSCPLPVSAGINPEPQCPYEIPVTPLKYRSTEKNQSVREQLRTVEACRKFDLDISEQPAVKARHSSPNRRFSFSLGKMTRSFSFKESTAGQVNFAASPDLHICNQKKEYANNRARSSPLRRLLDPLLKHRGTHLAEKVQQSKGNPSATSLDPLNENKVLHGKKHRSSNVQALLQLAMKNGVPFFKLVVDSSSDILAAAVKKFPSGKNDSSLTYAFYSVHEIKKKSGSWINQVSKQKGRDFGYNMIGQMKISSSYHAEFSGPEKDLYVVRESVLYGTDIGQAEQGTPDCLPNRELAAIIVKNPSEEGGGDLGSSKSMAVVLPSGIHSLPNSGQPSPLIDRWRSGGTCDCGGWDIGCQLRILTQQDEMVKIPSPTLLCSTSNHLDLRYQGRPKNEHVFSLAPLPDGLYSLEYDTSISLLQAFSVCVAVISSQKLTHIFQVNYLQEAMDFSKPTMPGDKKVKIQTTVGTEMPARYVSRPPASPVGRA